MRMVEVKLNPILSVISVPELSKARLSLPDMLKVFISKKVLSNSIVMNLSHERTITRPTGRPSILVLLLPPGIVESVLKLLR